MPVKTIGQIWKHVRSSAETTDEATSNNIPWEAKNNVRHIIKNHYHLLSNHYKQSNADGSYSDGNISEESDSECCVTGGGSRRKAPLLFYSVAII